MQDVICGLTVGVMSIPQGIAYAILSGLPPIFGLYTSFIPPLLYVFFGQSPQVSMGPFALTALLFSTALQKLVPEFNVQLLHESDPGGAVHQKIAGITATVAFCVGLLQLIMSALGLGFIAAYLSPPLTSGFTTAIAVYVFCTQLGPWMGIETPHFNNFSSVFQTIGHILTHLDELNPAPFLLAILGMFILYSLKFYNNGGIVRFRRKNPKDKIIQFPTADAKKPKYPIPGELVWVIIATLMSFLGNFQHNFEMEVVGNIPAGLPPFVFPNAFGDVLGSLISDLIIISVISYAFTMSLAKSFGGKFGYTVKANKELYAMGAINFISSFFSSFVVCAGLSRSLVLASMGAPSQLNNLLSVIIVMITLSFLTGAFYALPLCALSAIIIISLIGMFHQFVDAWKYWKVKTKDFVIWTVTFTTTLVFDIPVGMSCAVATSIIIVLYSTAKPYYCELVPVLGAELYRDKRRVREPKFIPHVYIYRFHSSLNFANADRFMTALFAQTVKKDQIPNGTLRSIIIDFSAINEVDSTSTTVLVEMFKKLSETFRIRLLLANVRGHVKDVLEKLNFSKVVGMKIMFNSIHEAVMFDAKHGESESYLRPGTHEDEDVVINIGDHNVTHLSHVLELKTMDLEKSLVAQKPLEEMASRLELGNLQVECSHPAFANEQFLRAYELSKQHHESKTELLALLGLAKTALLIKDFIQALPRFEEIAARATSDAALLCQACLGKGKALMGLFKFDQGIHEMIAALELSRQINDEVSESEICFEISAAYLASGNHDRSDEYHALGSQIAKKVLPKLEGASKHNLAKYLAEKSE